MKIHIQDKDITPLLASCTWAGSRLQVARRLTFSYVQDDRDPSVPVIEVDNSFTVHGFDDAGAEVFTGNIYTIEKDRHHSSVRVVTLDDLHVLGVSKTTRTFHDALPEDIAGQICSEMGVLAGTFAKTGVKVSFIANAKTGYQIIQGAYFEASKTTEKKYQCVMGEGRKLNVIEKGELIKDKATGKDWTAYASYNMTESVYKESIEKLMDQVLVVDDKGNHKDIISDAERIKKYSMFQEVYKEDPNKDTQKEVKDILEKKKPQRSGNITVLGDYQVRAPYSILVEDSLFKGQFWIKADTHTFKDGKHEMKLELEFENIMTEEKVEKEKEDKK